MENNIVPKLLLVDGVQWYDTATFSPVITMNKSFFLLIAAACLSLLLSSCGFQLRGTGVNLFEIDSFAMKTSQRFDGIHAEIQRLAEGQQIEISPQADWAIALGEEKVEQWRASTSQDYSKNEYWLSMSVDLTITNKQADIEYRPISLKRQAIFQDNTDQLNSKSSEKNIILAELRKNLAQQILQQLAYIINNPPDCECDEALNLQEPMP